MAGFRCLMSNISPWSSALYNQALRTASTACKRLKMPNPLPVIEQGTAAVRCRPSRWLYRSYLGTWLYICEYARLPKAAPSSSPRRTCSFRISAATCRPNRRRCSSGTRSSCLPSPSGCIGEYGIWISSSLLCSTV